jgi:calmodulin
MATIAVPGLSPAEVNDMKAAFTIFDRNLKGGITKQTLTAFYAQFGLALSPEDVDAMLSEFTGDPNKKIIDFQTFAKKMHEKKNMWASAFGDAFDMIDDKKTGKITAPRLKQVMGILGEKLTDEEAEEMIKVGGGSKAAFIEAMSGKAAGATGGGGMGGGGRGAPRGGRGGARGGRGARGGGRGPPILPRGARGAARAPRGGRGAPRLPRGARGARG